MSTTRIKLRESRRMTSAFKVSDQEHFQRSDGVINRSHPRAKTCDIRVIVLPSDHRIFNRANDRASSPSHPIHRHADALTAATDNHASINRTGHNIVSDVKAKPGIINPLAIKRANVVDLVASAN